MNYIPKIIIWQPSFAPQCGAMDGKLQAVIFLPITKTLDFVFPWLCCPPWLNGYLCVMLIANWRGINSLFLFFVLI